MDDDTGDLWLLTILWDLALARYSCVIAKTRQTVQSTGEFHKLSNANPK